MTIKNAVDNVEPGTSHSQKSSLKGYRKIRHAVGIVQRAPGTSQRLAGLLRPLLLWLLLLLGLLLRLLLRLRRLLWLLEGGYCIGSGSPRCVTGDVAGCPGT